MHPQIRQVGPGNCPICGMTLEPETVTADSGPSAELIDMTRRFWIGLVLDGPGDGARNGRPPHRTCICGSRPKPRTGFSSCWRRRSCCGPAGRFSSGLGLARQPQSQHVHADRHGHGRRLGLQRDRDGRARPVSAGVPRHGRRGRDLFRGGGGDYRPRAPRPGSRTARARTDRRRDPGAARSRAENRSPHPRRRHGRGNRPRRGRGRRSSARPPRRKGAGRRRTDRRPQLGRRIDGHRRVDAGREGRRREADRRHDQRHGKLRHARRQGRPRHDAGANRPDGRASAAQPRADPAPRRSGVRLVRAAGDRDCAPRFRGLGDLGAGAALYLRHSWRPSRC